MRKDIIGRCFHAENELHKYFGYVQDWKVIPLDDQRGRHWMICGPEDDNSTKIAWSPKEFTKASIEKGDKLYSGTIYTQRFLPKWVYHGKDYTMISVDTHSDGNQLLMIFENRLQCKDQSLIDWCSECW